MPPVQRCQLLLEEDGPAFRQAQPALLCGGVVPTGGGQDGPGDLVGDPLVLELPDMCAQGGPLLLSVVEVAVVAGDPLFGDVDRKAGVHILLDGGRLPI